MVKDTSYESKIIDAIQSEVTSATSPFLEFLERKAKLIIGIIVLFIISIIAYWGYSSSQDEKRAEEVFKLGEVTTIPDTMQRFEALQNYLKTAPKETKAEALFILLQTSIFTSNYEVAISSWKELIDLDANLFALGTIGIAGLYEKEGKFKEAILILEEALPKVNNTYKLLINEKICSDSEIIGDLERAIVAAEDILASDSENMAGNKSWKQKIASLSLKLKEKN